MSEGIGRNREAGANPCPAKHLCDGDVARGVSGGGAAALATEPHPLT